MVDIRDADFREKILKEAAKSAQDAELFWVTRHETPVSFEANRLKQAKYRETSGIALRLVKDGRIGFSSTTNLEDWKGLIRNAVEVSPFGAEAKFEFPEAVPYPSVDVYDPQVEKTSVERMVAYGERAIQGVVSKWPEVLCDIHIGRSQATVGIMNTRGCRAEYTKSNFDMSLQGTRVRGTDMLWVWDGQASCRPEDFTDELVKNVLRQLELAAETVPSPRGDLPVLFTPEGVASALLSPLLSGFSGKTVQQGASPLVGKLGQRVVSQDFSMWDEPTLAYVPGSRICDDEGVPSRKVPLLEEGTVANFLYDLQTAGQARTKSTGSAERSLGSLPGPGAGVLVVKEGNVSEEDIIADIQEGLVVEGLLGAGQSNVLGGDFKANVLLGYKIEKGKITGRVKDTMISGNAYKALTSLKAIGNKGKWVGGSLKTPVICCDGISVASSK